MSNDHPVMTPQDPENDPVHRGLHELGRQIEQQEQAAAATEPPPLDESAPGAVPTDGESEQAEPAPPAVPAARAEAPAPAPSAQVGTPEVPAEGGAPLEPVATVGTAGALDPSQNPVEKGLYELGLQIEQANQEPGPTRSGTNDAAPHRGPAHAAPKRKRSGRRTAAWVGGTLLCVLVLVIGSVAGYAWYLNHEIHRIDLKNLTSAPVKGVNAGTQNILMIGSTDRCALKVQNPAYGLCSQGVNGVNSDVVMILHLNPATHTVSILSIPRDLFVPNARKEGANKIDAGLYEGPDQLIAAIEEDYGIPIQHFVELNFDSFINVVNALGGVKMYFPEPVFDAYSGLNVQTTGCIDLNGTQALQVVRARHLQYKGPGVTTTDPYYWPYETQSDLARIRRDHEFLRVLATAVKQKGLGDPFTDQQLVSGVAGQLTVDSGFQAGDMINLVLNYHNVDVNSAPQLTLPVQVDQFGNYIYKGGAYGDIEFPAEPLDRNTVKQFLGLSAVNADTYSGGALPEPVGRHRVGAQRLGCVQPSHRHVTGACRSRLPHRHHR